MERFISLTVLMHIHIVCIIAANVNTCTRTPCKNGGICIDRIGSYKCKCPDQWSGPKCSEDVNECLYPIPVCKNGGTCQNTYGSYGCICPPAWTGKDCTADSNECAGGNPCFYGGTCQNTMGSFFCQCPQDVYECQEKGICLNNGTCVDTAGSYYCLCPNGWTGNHCEIKTTRLTTLEDVELSRKTKRRKKREAVMLNIARGTLAVRLESARRDEHKLLQTSRLGLDMDDIK